ncbi:MAG TPA: hypothetical protein VFS88_09970, partial [Micavibrio sp.]|nr:hypothetical protein [Micavibrio sp.]
AKELSGVFINFKRAKNSNPKSIFILFFKLKMGKVNDSLTYSNKCNFPVTPVMAFGLAHAYYL